MTAFLDDTTGWTDRRGHRHLLVEMTPEHRRAVVGMLLHEAWRLWDAFGRQGDDPLTWLEATPLMRRLRELQPDAPSLADMLLHNLSHRPDVGNEGRP